MCLFTWNSAPLNNMLYMWSSEAVARRCSVKKVFLKISQNSLRSTYSDASVFQWISCEIFFIEYLQWLLLNIQFFKNKNLPNNEFTLFYSLFVHISCFVLSAQPDSENKVKGFLVGSVSFQSDNIFALVKREFLSLI